MTRKKERLARHCVSGYVAFAHSVRCSKDIALAGRCYKDTAVQCGKDTAVQCSKDIAVQ